VQTFLPYPSFEQSAKCLDYRRLGKQRVEAFQILNALFNPNHGWRNHPAVKMWANHEVPLCVYMNVMIREWIRRGYRNTMECRTVHKASRERKPFWLGDEKFHSAHRAALLFKDSEWYGQFDWTEKPEIKYFWPV